MQMYMRVSTAWWLTPYLNTLMFFSRVSGFEPDMVKLQRVIHSAVRVKGPFTNAKG